MSTILVTGTGTGVGKTYVTAALVRQLIGQGKKVRALKPIITGWTDGDSDTRILMEVTGDTDIEKVSPWRFLAPLAADIAAEREGRDIDFEQVVNFCKTPFDGITLIEGAGGVMSPLNKEKTFLDLINELDIRSRTSFGISSKDPELNSASAFSVILVTANYLGSISHTLTALEVLKGRDVAVIINDTMGNKVSLEDTAMSLRSHSKAMISLLYNGKSLDHFALYI